MIRRTDPVVTALIIGLILAILYAPELAPLFVAAWVIAAVTKR